ncbi:O-methylsterigmatocystin oxidoreductase [Trametes pubescens]|uniref:O-methylsterigmatocystin oxidoreductase n=1 Tax=Trametes pubescens TaxID=154538 RepID=A0A1M2VA91_TRAPU|nr:O-methylsterigmatocystin oxidoreductase [Trametes pubescens]
MSISTTHLNVLFHRAPLIVPSVLHPTSLKGSMPTLWLVVIGVFTLLFALVQARKKKNGALPPGPKPLPIVGNVLDLTARELWVRATQWAKSYGDVVYLHVFGQGLLFLNTYEAAIDLLEKKGSIYSDKPALVMAGELCGCDNMVAFTRYGDKSRRQRRLMQKALGPGAIPTYHPLLEIETHALLRRLLDDSGNYDSQIRRYAGSLTLLVVYGYRVTANDDPFLNLAEECVDILSNRIASGGGIWPVDIFPFLKHLPLWFPGAGFKRKAIQWKAKMEEFTNKPFELVQARMTTTVIRHFLLHMQLHPEVAAKARKEIDSVVGTGRLPTLSDRPALPYVNAVMNECLRWGAPVPLGLPHRLMEDDVYNGMIIPRGTLVFANIWNMTRNPDVFPDPESFNPERYMEDVDATTATARDLRNFVFGFGRRRCPGSHLVDSSFWIVLASMLATFDIVKEADPSTGRPLEPVIAFENAVFRAPEPFPCSIKPRSSEAARLIISSESLNA